MARPKEYNRDDVLEKAMGLFWRKGFEGAHLQELVETTGLNRFSLYKEFGGKEGLFRESLKRYLNFVGDLGAELTNEPKGLENIRRYVARVAGTRFRYGCLLVNTMTDREVLDGESYQIVKQFMKGGEDLLRVNLEAAQERGEIAADTDTRILARFIATFDVGLVTYDALGPKQGDKTAIVAMLDRILK